MSPTTTPSTTTRAGLLAALGAGAWLRVGGLGREGLWLDELFSVRVASRESWAALIEDLARDVHPPAYFALLRVLVPAGAEDAAWRLPSALAGLVSIGAAAALAGRLGGSAAAVGAAWLVATAPGLVLLDREARGNAPMAALGLLLLAGLARPRPRVGLVPFLALAVVAAALVNTHLFGAFVLLGVGAWAVLDPEPSVPRRATLAVCAAGAVALLPWAGVLAGQVSHFVADPWYGRPSADGLGWVLFDLADERPGILALLLVGAAFAVPRAPRAVTLLVAIAAATVLVPQAISYGIAPILRTRSALLLLPTFLVVSAVGFGGLGRAGAALVALAAAAQALATWHVTRLDTRMEQWREAAAIVALDAAPGDLVLANHPHLWRHYLPDATLLDVTTPIDAASGAWVLLGHDVEPPATLTETLGGAEWLRDERLHGARVAKVGPLGHPLRFTLPDGAPGRVDGARVELWGAAEAVTEPLRVRGRCAVEVRATEDAAGDEPARLRVRVTGASGLLDEELAVGATTVATSAVELDGGPGAAEVRVAVRFVNDAVVDGRDRNVHLEEVRLRCAP